ncbi:flavonol sulfotransferase-like [Quercus suber]|uniref:Sulfotransferase n=1 Tax=Quercus suber TaxID=58331 RepID=A0AAW0JAK2_QUESU
MTYGHFGIRITSRLLNKYEGFCCGPYSLEGILLMAQDHFKPQPNQVILSSTLNSTITWLEALSFAIMTRSSCDESTNPLLTKMAHDLVPFLEFIVGSNVQTLDLDVPLVATHVPYTSLPKSIINSCCKVVYICSDPKDCYHRKSSAMEDLHLEDAFEFFCEGLSSYGPYWDHLLGYWRASLESPEKILFLKCEDLKNESIYWVKKMAQFMGYPFSFEKEEKGVNAKSLEVNKSGITQFRANELTAKNDTFFMKGKVGDWNNHLTLEMAMQLDQITK